MNDQLHQIVGLSLAADGGASGATSAGPAWLAAVPLLALLASILCGVTIALRNKTKAPAWIVVGCLAVAFGVTLYGFLNRSAGASIVHVFDWIHFSWGDAPGQSFAADFAFHMDGLSWLWMLFVTGLATLIALYASEYMSHDVGKGYGRFFAAFALFVFSMACLVMGDNLLLLYLGWEGVGLCSYLLIGYFYKKPSAVAAAKKAFIVNRIGDLGLAIGVFLTYCTFGTVQYDELFRQIGAGVTDDGQLLTDLWQSWAIPLLFMLGAFGKSAQLPLYVWLPDAMEGPTPVSALIHAATMVTAGVYLIARMFPMFAMPGVEHYALNITAWVGALTALLAATIGMAQFDIKRIMAYSTVSQLGYMFAGLGVLTTTGAAFHVFTHAFFKAALFLCCGAVMHGMAGQLDLRKLSGLGKAPGWKVVTIVMGIGCLNLAGFPVITAGYWSKDMILAEAFVTPGFQLVGWILLLTAGLTAYYTFRVFFRVFMGPLEYHPGDELHAHDDEHHGAADGHGADHGHAAHDSGSQSHGDGHGHGHGHGAAAHFHPHPPGWAINTVLALLGIACFAAIGTYFIEKQDHGWVGSLIHDSSAHYASPFAHHASAPDTDAAPHVIPASFAPESSHADPAHTDAAHSDPAHSHDAGHAHAGTFLGMDPHKVMYYVSAVVGIVGIAVAFVLHLQGRTTAARSKADDLLPMLGPIPRWAQNKWYVDELYEIIVRKPLLVLAHLFHVLDQLLVDGLVNLAGVLPRRIAGAIRPSQDGQLHGYARGMAGGIALAAIIVWVILV